MVWKPRLTVAAIVERKVQDQVQYLLVEELETTTTKQRNVFNQPAGHVEEGETIEAALCREVKEETGWQVSPEYLVGIYYWRLNKTNNETRTYMRLCYKVKLIEQLSPTPLDKDILATHWFSKEEIYAKAADLRSMLVLKGLEDYLAGNRHPLSLIQSFMD